MIFEGKNVRVSQHALDQIVTKRFDGQDVRHAIERPERVTDVTAYPGQVRAVGYGLAVVLEPSNSGREWLVRTVYKDREITAPRADQLATAEGRRYAERFAAGLGRG